MKTPEQIEICTRIDPGICGFPCRIRARKIDSRAVAVEIGDTECGQIRRLADGIRTVSMRDLFAPLTRNPVYMAAQQAGCHASCVVPAGILKTVEVAMEMALARPVCITFEACDGGKQ